SLGTQATPPTGGAPQQQAQAQPQFQQEDQLRQERQQEAQQTNLDKYKGMFNDYNTIAQNLLKTPGMTPQKLGRIMNSRGLQNMLTQEGLAAYRAAGLGIRQENTDISGQRLGALEDYRKIIQADKDRAFVYTSQSHALDAQQRVLDRTYNAKMGQEIFLPADKQEAAKKEIQDAYDTGSQAIEDKRGALDKQSQSSSSDTGSGSDPREEAKAAIAAGAPRDAVIKRFKELNPGLDASGL